MLARFLLLAFAAIVTTLPAAAEEELNPAQKQAVEAIVRDYLRDHPEMILEALQGLELRREAEQQERARQALAERRNDLHNDPTTPVEGNPKGDVTLVEFFDYRCGYCKQMASVIDEAVKANPDVRVLVKNLPILGPDSLEAARLILATPPHKRGALHHDLLSQSLDAALLQKLQAELGVSDSDKAKSDSAINEVRKLAADLNIQGTPALVVGSEIFYGAIPAEQLNAALAAARMAKK